MIKSFFRKHCYFEWSALYWVKNCTLALQTVSSGGPDPFSSHIAIPYKYFAYKNSKATIVFKSLIFTIQTFKLRESSIIERAEYLDLQDLVQLTSSLTLGKLSNFSKASLSIFHMEMMIIMVMLMRMG